MSMMSLADIEVSVEKNTFLSWVFLPGSRQSTMTTLTLRPKTYRLDNRRIECYHFVIRGDVFTHKRIHVEIPDVHPVTICLRLSLQSLNSAICVKFLRFVMLRKRIEVVTKKVLKLLCNFAVPLRASLMILVSWSSGRISISKLVCVTTANLLIIRCLTKF